MVSSSLRSSSSSIYGPSMPSWPCSCCSLFTHPAGGGILYSHSFTDAMGSIPAVSSLHTPNSSSSDPLSSHSSSRVLSGQHGYIPVISQGHNSTNSAVLVKGPTVSSEPHPLSGTPPAMQPFLPAGVSLPQGISPLARQFSPFRPPSMITPITGIPTVQ